MIEESAKQMTWHKHGKRYNADKMVHPSDGDAWKHFDAIHHDKAQEARNVRVALATDGFNPYGMMAANIQITPGRQPRSSCTPEAHMHFKSFFAIIDTTTSNGTNSTHMAASHNHKSVC
jgi:hypothetical protein